MKKVEINNDSVFIGGVEYVPKSDNSPVVNTVGMKMVLVRTYSAGVHFGYLAKRESTLAGIEVTLFEARRVYSWEKACTLSQLAMEGSKGTNNKISMAVNSIELVAIEIIEIPRSSNLLTQPVWKS